MLLTAFLTCGIQGASYSGELFWGLGEALGGAGEAVGAGLGAAGWEGIGAGFGAVGEGLGATGEGLGAAWETFDAVGEAFGVHPIELIATGGISALLRHIPLPEAHVRGRVRGASNVFVMPESGQIGIVVSGSVIFGFPRRAVRTTAYTRRADFQLCRQPRWRGAWQRQAKGATCSCGRATRQTLTAPGYQAVSNST